MNSCHIVFNVGQVITEHQLIIKVNARYFCAMPLCYNMMNAGQISLIYLFFIIFRILIMLINKAITFHRVQ